MATTLDGRQERGATAERILDAAEDLFAERGFAGTAVRDIAARVGVNPASLYNHFPGKQEIYEAVLERGLGPIFELLDDLASPDRSADDDDRSMERLVDHIAANPGVARLLQFEALGGGEHLARLAGRWLEPLYARGVGALAASPAKDAWEADELPLLVAAFHNMILGYFAMAPLLAMLLDEDPGSVAALERQKAFLTKVAERLVGPREV